MEGDISAYSTEELLRMSSDQTNRDLGHEADKCLFMRWRDGVDLEYLVKLLESNKTTDRLLGAFFLGESDPRGNAIEAPATELADDFLPRCRRAFVGYMTNSGLYRETIAVGLAKCMLDFSLDVRLAAINWAVYTTDARFEHFAQLVESGTGATDYSTWREPQLKRGSRALDISRRLRNGESIEEIRKSTPEEDSYTFDHLQVFERRLQRYAEWRKNKVSAAIAGASANFDDYEIGVLGEEYDNLGRLKSKFEDLPSPIPSHVTDAQLDHLIDRAGESVGQRQYDQRLETQYPW
jgi:hypothetical protein